MMCKPSYIQSTKWLEKQDVNLSCSSYMVQYTLPAAGIYYLNKIVSTELVAPCNT